MEATVKRVAMGALLLLLTTSGAGAVGTKVWELTTYKDFDEGDGDGVRVGASGEVMPGRDTQRVAISADAVWTAVRAADGTVYAGTLDKGEVLAISGGKVRTLTTLEKETPWIGALALGQKGQLYAGTVATASVYAIDTSSGKTSLVIKLPDTDHVWGLVASADGKTLWAATGSSGKLFAIDVAGKSAKVVWDSSESHLLSLLRAPDGGLWVGTADEAIVYRVDPASGQARAMADFAGTEVKALAWDNGALYAAVNDFDKKSGTAPVKKPQPTGTAIKPPEAGKPGAETPDSASQPRPGERKGKGAIFRVDADGRLEQVHALADGYFQTLGASGGTVYAGAGTGGRVVAVLPSGEVQTVFDVEERQVNALVAWEGGVAFATGDSAAFYSSAGAEKAGTYTSKVFDAGGPARWGKLRHGGSGAVVLETRSGNTAKPDAGWSAWQKLASGAIASPAGRYLQFRVAFGGAGAVDKVAIYYLPRNLRARLTEVTVGDPKQADRPPVTLEDGAAKPRSPVVKVKWKVDNTDGDELGYELDVRREGEALYHPLPLGTGDEPYQKLEYDWNTEGLPDGVYRLRVRVTDAATNPPELALTHELVSEPFVIDNARPTLTGLEVQGTHVAGRAVDAGSRIDEIAYSIDGGPWRMAYPRDGVFDDLSEAFTFDLPAGLPTGLHTLQVRAADEAENIVGASVTFRVGR
jgi:hypothetical protein